MFYFLKFDTYLKIAVFPFSKITLKTRFCVVFTVIISGMSVSIMYANYCSLAVAPFIIFLCLM